MAGIPKGIPGTREPDQDLHESSHTLAGSIKLQQHLNAIGKAELCRRTA